MEEINCVNCGSKNIDKNYVCIDCGTNNSKFFEIEEIDDLEDIEVLDDLEEYSAPIKTKVEDIVKEKDGTGFSNVQINDFYEFKTTIDKKDFLRKCVIYLGSLFDAPEDLVNVKFGKVEETIKTFIVLDGHVETDYHVSLGFDRREEYRDVDKKFVVQGGVYTYKGVAYRAPASGSYYMDVIKTRIVTDWSPFSGHCSCDCEGCGNFTEENWYTKRNNIESMIKRYMTDAIKINDNKCVSTEMLNLIKKSIEKKAKDNIEFPADHYQNDKYYHNTSITHARSFKVPYYEVEYEYKGKIYYIGSWAFGQLDVDAAYFPVKQDKEEYIIEEKTKNFKIVKNLLWVGFGISEILAFVFIFALSSGWGCIAPFVLYIVSVIVNVCYDKKYNYLINNIVKLRVKKKFANLKKALVHRELKPLSKDEQKMFTIRNNTEEISQYKKINTVKAPAIWCAILLAVLAYMMFVFNDWYSFKY